MTHFQLFSSKRYSSNPTLTPSSLSSPLPPHHFSQDSTRSSVSSSFLVPDIYFTFKLALLCIKTCNCYILPSIARCSIGRIFSSFPDCLNPLGRSCVRVSCARVSCAQIVFIQTPEGVLLASLLTPFSLPPSLSLWAHFKGKGYGMMEGFS